MKNPNLEDLVGQTFGEWKVLAYAGQDALFRRYWLCECTLCGERKVLNTTEAKQTISHGRCQVKKKQKEEQEKKNICKKCDWWMRLSMSDIEACHYCYYNYHSRPRNADGSCASYKQRTGKNRKSAIMYGKEIYPWLKSK